MPLDLGGDFYYVVLVADADTPADLQGFAGRVIALPTAVTLPDGFDSITFSGQTFWGTKRYNSSSGNWEWVMAPPQNPNIVFLDSLPGPGGWLVDASRTTVRQVGQILMRRGMAGPDLRQGMQQVYAAVVAERDAEILAAGGALHG